MSIEGEIYIFTQEGHPRNGGKYKILHECLMKDPSTREWLDCIVYQQFGNYEKPMIFVREKSDFLSKFLPENKE